MCCVSLVLLLETKEINMSRLSKAGGKLMAGKNKIPDPITAAMVCSDVACALLLFLANFSNQIRNDADNKEQF